MRSLTCTRHVLCKRIFSSETSPKKATKYVPNSGHYPLGFLSNSIATGVKKAKGAKDLTLVTSPSHQCTTSAVFTKNSFCAAPVQLSKIVCEMADKSGQGLHALVINSGCANACTGQKGLEDAKTMIQKVDTLFKFKQAHPQTLIMSTGVIGQPLQMDKILKGLDVLAEEGGLGNTHEHWLAAAQGIMTTDTFPKLKSKEIELPNGQKFRLAGICKGAGMSMSRVCQESLIDHLYC